MNLVSKEYVACHRRGEGVLVLSEFAGAAAEMGEAFLVNPYDEERVAAVLERVLNLPAEERRERMVMLYRRVRRNTVFRWPIASSPSWTEAALGRLAARRSGRTPARGRRPGVVPRGAQPARPARTTTAPSSPSRRVRAMRSPARGGRSRRPAGRRPRRHRRHRVRPLARRPGRLLRKRAGPLADRRARRMRALAHHARMGDGASRPGDEWRSASARARALHRPHSRQLPGGEGARAGVASPPGRSRVRRMAGQRAGGHPRRDAGRDGAAGHPREQDGRGALRLGQQGRGRRSPAVAPSDAGSGSPSATTARTRTFSSALRGEAWTVRVAEGRLPRAIRSTRRRGDRVPGVARPRGGGGAARDRGTASRGGA